MSRLVLHNTAAGLRFQTRDDAQQRGLAAARGAQQAQHFALLDLQVDVLEHRELVKAFVHALDRQCDVGVVMR
ncbi:hypothetical protein LP416_01190 [Polaromonas sp. P2-4]|nr:hypothetical protein LP416_01190 [Polaromonas sp. P2-4]